MVVFICIRVKTFKLKYFLQVVDKDMKYLED